MRQSSCNKQVFRPKYVSKGRKRDFDAQVGASHTRFARVTYAAPEKDSLSPESALTPIPFSDSHLVSNKKKNTAPLWLFCLSPHLFRRIPNLRPQRPTKVAPTTHFRAPKGAQGSLAATAASASVLNCSKSFTAASKSASRNELGSILVVGRGATHQC